MPERNRKRAGAAYRLQHTFTKTVLATRRSPQHHRIGSVSTGLGYRRSSSVWPSPVRRHAGTSQQDHFRPHAIRFSRWNTWNSKRLPHFEPLLAQSRCISVSCTTRARPGDQAMGYVEMPHLHRQLCRRRIPRHKFSPSNLRLARRPWLRAARDSQKLERVVRLRPNRKHRYAPEPGTYGRRRVPSDAGRQHAREQRSQRLKPARRVNTVSTAGIRQTFDRRARILAFLTRNQRLQLVQSWLYGPYKMLAAASMWSITLDLAADAVLLQLFFLPVQLYR